MKIIYIGGYTNKDNSHFQTYKELVQKHLDNNKKVIVIALAQDAGYFAPRIKELYKGEVLILEDTHTEKVDWNSFDLIYILGGNSKKLKEGLLKYEFDLNKLSRESTIICDSAGANMLAGYYIGKDTNGYTIEKGLNTASNTLILCHCDNQDKTPLEKIGYAKEMATKNNYELLLLNENQSFTIEL